jgi:hypothetical protein
MRRVVLGGVLMMVIGGPALVFGQWVRYPTAGVPTKADGSPDLTAPAPRLPGGKPDFSGTWRPFNPRRCTPGTGRFVECGAELGGAPQAGNIGLDLPGGIHTPALLALLYEVNAMYRQIFIDGRPLPDDPTPTWNGYSVARWDGDALVVQTLGFRDGLWLDMGGSPMSDAAKMTERIRRPNFGSLEIDVTVDDPKVYTRPWTVSLKQMLALDLELMDEFCLENEKSYQRMIDSRGR